MGDGKLKKKAFDPRSAFGAPVINVEPAEVKETPLGPQEQTIEIDQSVERGGTIGETIGAAKPKRSFARSTGNMTAGRSRSGSR